MNNRNNINTAKGYYGEVRVENGQEVLRFERQFRHPPEKVWRALIEPDELRGWFPSRIEGERALGATLRFVFEGEDESPLEGTIVEFDPPRLLTYTWDQEVLRWELHANAEGCLLLFTITLDPRYLTLNSATGWHLCFEVLEAQLNGEAVTWAEEERTEELRAAYAERLK